MLRAFGQGRLPFLVGIVGFLMSACSVPAAAIDSQEKNVGRPTNGRPVFLIQTSKDHDTSNLTTNKSTRKAVLDGAYRCAVETLIPQIIQSVFWFNSVSEMHPSLRDPLDSEHFMLLHVVNERGKPIPLATIEIVDLVSRPSQENQVVSPTNERPDFPNQTLEDHDMTKLSSNKQESQENDIPNSWVAHYRLLFPKTTSCQGIARIGIPKDPKVGLAVKVTAAGYEPFMMVWNAGVENRVPIPPEHTIRLAVSRTIGGTVTDESGIPIQDATVTLTKIENTLDNSHSWSWVFRRDLQVQTDSEGRWKCSQLAALPEKYQITIQHDRYVEQDFDHSVMVLLREELLAQKHVCQMKKGLVVRGTILDSQGKPLPDAHISLVPTHLDFRGNSTTANTTTDRSGKFRIANCLPGNNSIIVTSRKMKEQRRNIYIGPEMPAVDFQLEPSPVLTVRVVDQDGKPVSGADVNIDKPIFFPSYSIVDSDKTDAFGKWILSTLPDGEFGIYIKKAGFGSVGKRIQPGSFDHEVVLRPVVRITGQVIDAVTKKPVPNVLLIPLDIRLNDEQRHFRCPSLQMRQDSRFEFAFIDASAGAGLAWQFRCEAVGYSTLLSKSFEMKEGSQTMIIEMVPGRSIKGVVKLPDGSPVAGASVFISTASNSVVIDRIDGPPSTSSSTRTNTSGYFELPLPMEPYAVGVIHAQGGAEISAEELDLLGEITLQPWGRVEGVVEQNTVEKETTSVSLSMNDNEEMKNNKKSRPHVDWNFSADLVPSGRFLFEHVLPGRYTLEPDAHSSSLVHQVWFSPWPEQIINVKPGQTLKVPFGEKSDRTMKGCMVIPETGRVKKFGIGHGVFLFQKPPASNSESLKSPTNEERNQGEKKFSAVTLPPVGKNQEFLINSDGHFKVANVVPGSYRLIAELYPETDLENAGEPIAWLNQEVTIPDEPGKSEIDLGAITTNANSLFLDDRAPDIEFTTEDGTVHHLSDYQGKMVVLQFSQKDYISRWDQYVIETKTDLWKEYGGAPLVWISLEKDRDSWPTNSDLHDDDLEVIHGKLIAWEETWKKYDVRDPSMAPDVTISPNGRILVK